SARSRTSVTPWEGITVIQGKRPAKLPGAPVERAPGETVTGPRNPRVRPVPGSSRSHGRRVRAVGMAPDAGDLGSTRSACAGSAHAPQPRRAAVRRWVRTRRARAARWCRSCADRLPAARLELGRDLRPAVALLHERAARAAHAAPE